MAKKKAGEGPKAKKKKPAKAGPTEKVKAKKPKKAKKAKKAKKVKGEVHTDTMDRVAKVIEHPIVADLIAVGATAAVTALAAGVARSKGDQKNARAVKAAGKAAAAAIGARLVEEFRAVRDSAKEAADKRDQGGE